jgi:hypothetical protein
MISFSGILKRRCKVKVNYWICKLLRIKKIAKIMGLLSKINKRIYVLDRFISGFGIKSFN